VERGDPTEKGWIDGSQWIRLGPFEGEKGIERGGNAQKRDYPLF